jgi:SAM-dependent methyltransferase
VPDTLLNTTPPVAVKRRPRAMNRPPEGAGTECFDTDAARQINRARMDHLDSLGLDLDGKRVLDVGCGVGHLAQYFVKRGCEVTCVDGRESNLARLRELYPTLADKARVMDVENDSLATLGRFDVVFCYGLLYHTENPLRVLRNLASVEPALLLLETMVCDHRLPVVRAEDEWLSASQALNGLAVRPSPAYVAFALSRVGFEHVYAPLAMPDYPDFRFEFRDSLDIVRDGHPLRCVFVASKAALPQNTLSPLL